MTILAQQSFRERQKRLHVIEICDHAHGDPHRAAGLAVNAQAEVINGETVFVTGFGETYIQFNTGNAKSYFPCAGIAKTTCAK